MKEKLLTLVATAAMLLGGMVWTDTAEAQRRWNRGYGGYYGSYYGGPRYVRPYYSYGYRYARPYRYYDSYYYGYPRYYRGYSYGYPRYYSPGVYLGGRNAGVYLRF